MAFCLSAGGGWNGPHRQISRSREGRNVLSLSMDLRLGCNCFAAVMPRRNELTWPTDDAMVAMLKRTAGFRGRCFCVWQADTGDAPWPDPERITENPTATCLIPLMLTWLLTLTSGQPRLCLWECKWCSWCCTTSHTCRQVKEPIKPAVSHQQTLLLPSSHYIQAKLEA